MLDREHDHAGRFLDEAIQRYRPGDRAGIRVLDFGCGSGALVSTLAALGYQALRYRRLSLKVFGNYSDATELFMERGYGGLAALSRRLRVPAALAGLASSTFRMSFLINKKSDRVELSTSP